MKILAAISTAVLVSGIVYACFLWAWNARSLRKVDFTDLSLSRTQIVSVPFSPTSVRWKAWGKVGGSGTLIIPYVLSNTFTGSFSTNGRGDYYDSNAPVIFLPSVPGTGAISAVLRFDDF